MKKEMCKKVCPYEIGQSHPLWLMCVLVLKVSELDVCIGA